MQLLHDCLFICLSFITGNRRRNYSKDWTPQFLEIAGVLRKLSARKITEESAQVFEDIRWTLLGIVRQCIRGIVSFADYASRRRFIEGVFRGDHIKKLRNAFFNDDFYKKVLTLPNDLLEKVTINEKAEIKEFIESLLDNIKIAVYLNFTELSSLIEKEPSLHEPSQLSVLIDLPGTTKRFPLLKSDAMCRRYQKVNPSG